MNDESASRPSDKKLREALREAGKELARTPIGAREYARATPLATGAATGAALGYWLLPDLAQVSRAGAVDEVTAVLTTAAGLLFGSLNKVGQLCGDELARKAEREWNLGKGAAGGFLAGAGLTQLNGAAFLMPLDGGITLAATALGAMGASWYNRARRKKYCPYCGRRQSCEHRVCRSCLRVFFPVEVSRDCDTRVYLDWPLVLSFLQLNGLNYFQAEEFVIRHFDEWEINGGVGPKITDRGLVVPCKAFWNWIDRHPSALLDYDDKQLPGLGSQEAAERLDKAGL